MKLRRIRVKWIIAFYLTIAFFRGCFISNVFRLGLLGDGLGVFLVGMSWTLAPYVLLALVALAFSRIISSRQIKPSVFTRIAKVALLLIIPLTIGTIHTNKQILEFERGVREYSYMRDRGVYYWHWITTWWSGCLFGLAILLFGVVSIVRHSEKSDSRPSEGPSTEDRHG